MNIQQLAKKPELEELKLDDEGIIETYGEPISFWMSDHVDLTTYFDFFKYQGDKDGEQLMQVLRRIIKKEDGTPAIDEEAVLPVDITLAALMKVNDHLGKSRAKLSTKEVGTQQD
jgi:hypothetical protein